MAVLGIIILIGVAVVTATVVANGAEPAVLNLVGFDVNTTIAGIYAVGALCLLLTVLGIFLLLGGAKRSNRRRKEVRDLRRQADHPVGADPSGTSAGTSSGSPPKPLVGQGGDPVRNERAARRHETHPDDPDEQHFRGVPRD
jgi:hypothetical protein